MASCGVGLNLSSLESKITGNISAMLGLAGITGLPYTSTGLIAGIAIAQGNYLGALKIVVPSEALEGVWSGIRDEIGALFDYADVPSALTDEALTEMIGGTGVAGSYDATKLAEVASGDGFWSGVASGVKNWNEKLGTFAESTGLSSVAGYVDIDFVDLAKSAVGLGVSFDKCDFGVSGIANYARDPGGSAVRLMANYAPKLGDTNLALNLDRLNFSAAEYLTFAARKNSTVANANATLNSISSSLSLDSIYNWTPITSAQKSSVTALFESNNNPAHSALGESIRRTATGELVVDTQASVLDRLKTSISGVLPDESSTTIGATVSF